jgi:carbonic anhydrase/acetyltransferase-like protein (isoleucine patch superfamily)
VIIGDKNIFEDKVKLVNSTVKIDGKPTIQKMVIGNCNTFKTRAKLITSNIGDNNVICERALLDLGTNLKEGCIIEIDARVPRFTKLR